jgi:hypothetical protein
LEKRKDMNKNGSTDSGRNADKSKDTRKKACRRRYEFAFYFGILFNLPGTGAIVGKE